MVVRVAMVWCGVVWLGVGGWGGVCKGMAPPLDLHYALSKGHLARIPGREVGSMAS